MSAVKFDFFDARISLFKGIFKVGTKSGDA